MEKTFIGGPFNPASYEMMYCLVCKGSGKLFNEVEVGVVCKACGVRVKS